MLLFMGMLAWLYGYGQQVRIVRTGDAESLLEAIAEANKANAAADAPWFYILIPNGTYDLGERVLTRITGHRIALVGQSMTGTVIMNKPDVKTEGISKTAVLQNRGSDNYLQDLTLKNALDYYAAGSAGRAVTLHDKGTRTICNRVCLLSYQDTYYSDNEASQFYFQDSEIHGTVDFICGGGDVWFERCRIVTEKRSADGKGRDVIAAPRTKGTEWGYIFHRCTVENIVSDFEYARGWADTPHCIWLYTTLLTPERLTATRFDSRGMRTIQSDFKELGTMDSQGRDITPRSNVVTFTLKDECNAVETILTAEQARRYTVKNVFADWKPLKTLRQMEKRARKLWRRSE